MPEHQTIEWNYDGIQLRRRVQSTMDVCRNIISVHPELWCFVKRVISIWNYCMMNYILFKMNKMMNRI